MVYPEYKSHGEAEVSQFIESTADKVWKAVSDLANPQAWDGLTLSTRVREGKKSGMGLRRRRELSGGTVVEEEVVHWIDRREFRTAWQDTAIPMRQVRMMVRVVDAGRGRTAATFKMTYLPRFWLLGKLADYLVIRPSLTRMLTAQLQNLDAYCRR